MSTDTLAEVELMERAGAFVRERTGAQPSTPTSPWSPPWVVSLKDAFVSAANIQWPAGKALLTPPGTQSESAEIWDAHWQRLKTAVLGRAFSTYRRQFRARSVRAFLDRLFPKQGLFAECGCGTAETSCRLTSPGRTILAVDFSQTALQQALRVPTVCGGVLADIRDLPFRDRQLDGIWNLGVLEHFVADEQMRVLSEFHRSLKPGGRIVLWWPPPYGLDHVVLSRFGKFFPDEPGRVTRRQARELLEQAGFSDIDVFFPWNDCLTQLVVTGVRPR